jgi:peptide/nickel transport system permease protein
MATSKKKNEFLYFALRNNKLKIGFAVLMFFIVLTFVGPLLTDYEPLDYIGPIAVPPSSEYWFGTTTFGQDVYTIRLRSKPLFWSGSSPEGSER